MSRVQLLTRNAPPAGGCSTLSTASGKEGLEKAFFTTIRAAIEERI